MTPVQLLIFACVALPLWLLGTNAMWNHMAPVFAWPHLSVWQTCESLFLAWLIAGWSVVRGKGR